MLCEFCGKSYTSIYGSGRFCSSECARTYSSRADNFDETKEAVCVECGDFITINKHTSIKNAYCKKCKDRMEKERWKRHNQKTARKKRLSSIEKNQGGDTKTSCKICGCCVCFDVKMCRPNLIKNLILFGLDETKIGSVDIYKEVSKIKNVLNELYIDFKMSRKEICEYFEIDKSVESRLWYVFKQLGICQRSLSEAVSNAVVKGRLQNVNAARYKSGWHTTWNGKRFFYRSSYELDYCLELDGKQIDYEMETLSIQYWDSSLLKFRTSIPDFYIPKENLIVEIKSDWTYDKQNMIDRKNAYINHGYSFKLVLEHNEINL